jgi:hypothetical protein
MRAYLESVFVVGTAIVAGLVGSVHHCSVYNACKGDDACGNTTQSGCSFVTHVGLVGDRLYGGMRANESLSLLTRGVCAPGERMQMDFEGVQRCFPFRPWPNALTAEIEDASKTVPHERYCGAWIKAGSSTITKPEYFAFYREDEAADAMKRLEAVSYTSPFLATSDLGKFHATCTRAVLGGSAALRAAAVKAYQYMLSHLPDATTKEGALKNLGKLASFHCPTPVTIGITMSNGGFDAKASNGYHFSRRDLARLLYAIEANDETQQLAEEGNAVVNEWAHNSDAATLADFDMIFEGATGIVDSSHVTLDSETTPWLDGFLVLISQGDFARTNAYLKGVAATCATTLQQLADASLGDIGATHDHDHNRPVSLALRNVHRQHEEVPALDRIFRTAQRFATLTTEELSRSVTAGFAQLIAAPVGDAGADCTALARYVYPDAVDSLRFDAVVPDALYARVGTLISTMRAAVLDTVQNYGPIRNVIAQPAVVEAAITSVRVRIPGAPSGTWGGSAVGTTPHAISSDDGVFVRVLKQANAVFKRRMVGLVYDELPLCDGPPSADSTEMNAYIYPSHGCSFLLLGILRRPFSDDRYDDVSLATRVGYIVAHEIGHLELTTTRNTAAADALLHRYDTAVHAEAFADVIAAVSIIRSGQATREEMCGHVSQVWCARVPLFYEHSGVHPAPNVRGDALCATLIDLGL